MERLDFLNLFKPAKNTLLHLKWVEQQLLHADMKYLDELVPLIMEANDEILGYFIQMQVIKALLKGNQLKMLEFYIKLITSMNETLFTFLLNSDCIKDLLSIGVG
jgi:hypothetical protein